MSQKKRFILLIKFLISAGLICFLYRNINIADLKAYLSDIDIRYLPLVFCLLLVNTLLSSWKWQILLEADSVRVPLRTLCVSYLIGSFFNIFLPSTIGGDAYRVYDISKFSFRPASSFASVLADRLSGFVALSFLAIVSSTAVLASRPEAHALGASGAALTGNLLLVVTPLAILLALLSIIWALYWQWPVRRLLRITGFDRFMKLSDFVEKCLGSFSEYRRRLGVIFKIMAISFVFQSSVILCIYLLATCLYIRVPFIFFCAFVPLISLVEAIPISIYGVGIRDSAYVFFFSMAGMSEIQTRALPLLYLATTVVYSLVGGALFLFKSHLITNPDL